MPDPDTASVLTLAAAAAPAAPGSALDVPYGAHDGQVLDVHLPRRSGRAPRPTVVFFHGGGWMSGSRADVSPLVRAQLARGWVVVSVGYRLVPAVRWPTPLTDVKQAVRWVRANAERFRIDPDRLVAWGPSAGGHLAAMVGLTADDPAWVAPDLPADLVDVSDGVTAWVSTAGVADLATWLTTEHPWPRPLVSGLLDCDASLTPAPDRACGPAVLRAAAPLTHVDAGDAPGYLLHGAEDPLVPVAQARALYDAQQQVGLDGWLDVVDSGHPDHRGHAPDFGANRLSLLHWLHDRTGA